MEEVFSIEKLKKTLTKVAEGSNDKVSRTTVRKWMTLNWVEIMEYLKDTLVKDTVLNRKFTKVQTINTLVISVIHNFLNYRIINELGLTNDEANTKFDQVLTKHITKIQAMFKKELAYMVSLREQLCINVKDDSGFIVVMPNIELTPTDEKDIIYGSDLKERRFFCVIKRENSFIKYEKGLTIAELKIKYPNTDSEVHGIHSDIPDEDIVVFDSLDRFYRAIPADMSYGIREMDNGSEFTIVTVMDQKRLTGNHINFFECRKSGNADFQKAADVLSTNGIYSVLTKDIVKSLTSESNSPTMNNSFIVWDGHPSTFKLGSESNYQLLNLRHIDFDQTITKAIRDSKWTSHFINNLMLISTGDNMFNITASMDRLREGIAKDQNSLRNGEIIYHDLVRKVVDERIDCIRTEGDVNITAKTAKVMQAGHGEVTINGTHEMKKGMVVTNIITRNVAFIKIEPEDDYTASKYQILKEISVPPVDASYEESESSLKHTFYIKEEDLANAATKVLLTNEQTEGPVNSISSVTHVKDLVAGAFGTVPPLEILTKDEMDMKLAKDTFTPFNISESRFHVNSGCVKGNEMDASFNIKYYGKGKLFSNTVESVFLEALNSMSLIVKPITFKYVQEFKPLEYQTLNSVVTDTVDVFDTNILRGNYYSVLLKISRTEIHELIYSYKTVKVSSTANLAYAIVAKLISDALTYNPYFYIMLGMKYDIDSRFSNEIVAAWDAYLLALKDYTSIEKLVIHHMLVVASKQKLLDVGSTADTSARELVQEKNNLIKSYESKSKFYAQAIADIKTDLDNDENIQDRVYGGAADEQRAKEAEAKVELVTGHNNDLKESNSELSKSNAELTKELERQEKMIESMKKAADKKPTTPKKSDK